MGPDPSALSLFPEHEGRVLSSIVISSRRGPAHLHEALAMLVGLARPERHRDGRCVCTRIGWRDHLVPQVADPFAADERARVAAALIGRLGGSGPLAAARLTAWAEAPLTTGREPWWRTTDIRRPGLGLGHPEPPVEQAMADLAARRAARDPVVRAFLGVTGEHLVDAGFIARIELDADPFEWLLLRLVAEANVLELASRSPLGALALARVPSLVAAGLVRPAPSAVRSPKAEMTIERGRLLRRPDAREELPPGPTTFVY